MKVHFSNCRSAVSREEKLRVRTCCKFCMLSDKPTATFQRFVTSRLLSADLLRFDDSFRQSLTLGSRSWKHCLHREALLLPFWGKVTYIWLDWGGIGVVSQPCRADGVEDVLSYVQSLHYDSGWFSWLDVFPFPGAETLSISCGCSIKFWHAGLISAAHTFQRSLNAIPSFKSILIQYEVLIYKYWI